MEQYELLDYLVAALEKTGVRYFVAGSMASIFYGEPRYTNDIDVVADMRNEHVTELIDHFPADDFYVSEDAAREAIRLGGQFNIIHSSSGLKIDVIIRRKNDFDDSQFERARLVSTSGKLQANFSSPEDVIIMKMKYYKEGESEKHLRDITGMLKISGESIDRQYIENWTKKFGLTDIWNSIQKKLQR